MAPSGFLLTHDVFSVDITGWIWLIGNVTITLSGTYDIVTTEQCMSDRFRPVNFGFASLLSATVSMYHPDFTMNDWQLLLIFYAVCLVCISKSCGIQCQEQTTQADTHSSPSWCAPFATNGSP